MSQTRDLYWVNSNLTPRRVSVNRDITKKKKSIAHHFKQRSLALLRFPFDSSVCWQSRQNIPERISSPLARPLAKVFVPIRREAKTSIWPMSHDNTWLSTMVNWMTCPDNGSRRLKMDNFHFAQNIRTDTQPLLIYISILHCISGNVN